MFSGLAQRLGVVSSRSSRYPGSRKMSEGFQIIPDSHGGWPQLDGLFHGQSYWNWWFRGTPIVGNHYRLLYMKVSQVIVPLFIIHVLYLFFYWISIYFHEINHPAIGVYPMTMETPNYLISCWKSRCFIYSLHRNSVIHKIISIAEIMESWSWTCKVQLLGMLRWVQPHWCFGLAPWRRNQQWPTCVLIN